MDESTSAPAQGLAAIGTLGSSVQRFVAVADTNAILASVDNDCRHDRRSRIVRSVSAGACNLFAADHVYDELAQNLRRFASSTPVPHERLRCRLEETYLPLLRFVTVCSDAIDDPQVLAITDLDDVPTGALAKTIAPCVVWSEDKHLRRPGLAPKRWREVAGSGAELAEADQALVGSSQALVLGGSLVVASTSGVARRVGVPSWVLWLGAGGLACAYLSDAERRGSALRASKRIGNGVAAFLGEVHDRQERGMQGLQEAMVSPLARPDCPQMAAGVLARAPEPLLAKEVQQRMFQAWPEDVRPTVSELRSILTDHAMFVEGPRWRWSLGTSRTFVPRA